MCYYVSVCSVSSSFVCVCDCQLMDERTSLMMVDDVPIGYCGLAVLNCNAETECK